MESRVKITSDREMSIESLLNAPVALVWKVFTEPEHIASWWGPEGFTNTIDKMDVRPGGVWEFTMHGPDGKDYKNKAVYIAIAPFRKIMFDHFAPNFKTSIDFTEQNDQTQISWNMLFETSELFNIVVKTFKADEGLEQNITKLKAYLAILRQ